jgi:uncharacterized protein (TIGR00269 family)
LGWFAGQVAKTVRKRAMFSMEDRLLIAVSGGKDSLGLWDVLLRLGYQTDGLYIHLGIEHEAYSDASEACARAFVGDWDGAGVTPTLHVVNVGETYGVTVPELAARGRRNACSLCGVIKRYVMNQRASELGYDVLVTGHNLDDEVALLFQNTLHWETSSLARQGPVLPAIEAGFVRKVKPLALLYERESAAYVLARGMSYMEEECPYGVNATSIAHKRLLNQVEWRSPNAKYQFYATFLKAREKERVIFEAPAPPTFGTCRLCGQPTTTPGMCAFCRLWRREAGEA